MQENTAENIELELPEEEDNTAADLEIEASDQLSEAQAVEEAPASAEDRVKEFLDTDDELKEYGDGVQKRIDKLTYKYREAERREQAAIEYAQGVQAQLQQHQVQADAQLKQQDATLFNEYGSRVDSELEQAKAAYKAAFDSGDPDAIVEANQELSRLSVEQENLRRVKVRRDQAEQAPPPPMQQYAPPPVPQAPPAPDTKAEAWAEKNDWFGQDEAMTYAAFGIHRNLVEQEGIDPTSDTYYTELDKRVHEAFPHKFQSSARPVQTVASAQRSSKPQNARKVKLTQSQVAIANRLGVPLEEYAKYVTQ